jgi:heat shock protein HtpX
MLMRNYGKTAVLLAGLGGLFVVLGGVLLGQGGLYIGLAIGLVMVGGSYWFSDKLAIASARGVEVSAAQAPDYHRIVVELTGRADMPMPRLFIAPSDQPNAFATGRNPKHAAVCVNQGLLQLMSWDEVRGVLAHELMHIRNRDILTGSIAAAVGMAITFAARMAMWSTMFSGGRDRDRDSNPLVLLATALLAPIAAMVIQMAISRSREYSADAGAAKLIGDGEPLAQALLRLEAYSTRIPAAVNPSQASNYIVNPLAGRKVAFANLFSTHPPVQERVARLRGRDWR